MPKKKKEPEEESPKIMLHRAKPRNDPEDPIEIVEFSIMDMPADADAIAHLESLGCKVDFRFRKAPVVNKEPVTIEGLKVVRTWEENGMLCVEFEYPEGFDPEEVFPRIFPPAGNIEPDQDFYKDYDV